MTGNLPDTTERKPEHPDTIVITVGNIEITPTEFELTVDHDIRKEVPEEYNWVQSGEMAFPVPVGPRKPRLVEDGETVYGEMRVPGVFDNSPISDYIYDKKPPQSTTMGITGERINVEYDNVYFSLLETRHGSNPYYVVEFTT